MKYVIALLLGMLCGASLFAAVLYWNPFATRTTVSPLAVTNGKLRELEYSLVPRDAVAYVNDGDSRIPEFPARIQELWEPAVSDSTVLIAQLRDARGEAAGIGIKFSTVSESSRLLDTTMLTDSYWHIWLPASGSITVEQVENRWPWLRDVVIPAFWSSGDNWRGTWFGLLTTGPNALGTARVTGGSGSLAGSSGEGVESLRAQAYSTHEGAVAGTGSLTISMRR